MSIWGLSNFENDTAVEFLESLNLNGPGLIRITLESVFENAAVSDCEEALAASEIIAAIKGKPADELPESARDFIDNYLAEESPEQEPISALNELAADAIDLIVTNSQLRELWELSPDFDKWFANEVDLQKRLLD